MEGEVRGFPVLLDKPEPTGQGTGLGLSLSYDIVKVRSGETRYIRKKVGVQSLYSLAGER